MGRSRKIIDRASAARDRYTAAAADLLMEQLQAQGEGATESTERLDQLRRRAGAYEVQWLAAERAAELEQDRTDAR